MRNNMKNLREALREELTNEDFVCLFEIGKLKDVEPYDFIFNGKVKDKFVYTFETDEGTSYVVELINDIFMFDTLEENKSSLKIPDRVKNVEQSDFFILSFRTEEGDFGDFTNKGEVFRVFKTVADLAFEFMRERGIGVMFFAPERNDDEFEVPVSKRARVYQSFLQASNFQTGQIDEDFFYFIK